MYYLTNRAFHSHFCGCTVHLLPHLSSSSLPLVFVMSEGPTPPQPHPSPPQSAEDDRGHASFGERLYQALHPKENPSGAACGSVPSASRMPNERIAVRVVGGDAFPGSQLMAGLTNPAYAPAFEVSSLPASALQELTTPQLEERLKGVHTVILTTSGLFAAEEESVWPRLLAACRSVGVKRLVPSPFTANFQQAKALNKPFVDRALQHQSALTDSQTVPLDWVLISCGILTETLFSPIAGVDVQNGVVKAPGSWTAPFTTTTLDDLANFLPEILLSKASHNKRIRVSSCSTSYGDIAQLLDEVRGSPVRRELLSAEDVQRAANERPDDSTALWQLIVQSGKGATWRKGDSFNAEHIPHVETTSLKQWVQQHLKAQHSSASAGSTLQANLHPLTNGLSPLMPGGKDGIPSW